MFNSITKSNPCGNVLLMTDQTGTTANTPRLSDEEYCKVQKEKTKLIYDNTPSVLCPYLKENVNFNSDGFHHFQYNTLGAERPKRVQTFRYKLFPLAPILIGKAGTIQQHRKTFGPVGRKKRDGFTAMKHIEDWCIIAVVPFRDSDLTIKIILRRIGDGNINFLSILPYKAPNYLNEI